MSNVTKLICIHAVAGNSFTVGKLYDYEVHGDNVYLCSCDDATDLERGDWFELSTRVDGIYFLIGYQQDVLFRQASEIEIDMENVVVFPAKAANANDERGFILEEANYCRHPNITVNEAERKCRCAKCGSAIEAFDYLLKVAKKEATFASNINHLSNEEAQRRSNIEKLNQIERNAKARAKRVEPDFNVIIEIQKHCDEAIAKGSLNKGFAERILRIIKVLGVKSG